MARHTSSDLLWSQIVAKAWCDDAFMTRLRSKPREVFAEHDLQLPEDTDVLVLEGEEVKVADSGTARQFILTVKPPDELEEEDLVGGAVSWCGCAACAACRACARCVGACGRCGACGCRCW
jgi:hypothetical protein